MAMVASKNDVSLVASSSSTKKHSSKLLKGDRNLKADRADEEELSSSQHNGKCPKGAILLPSQDKMDRVTAKVRGIMADSGCSKHQKATEKAIPRSGSHQDLVDKLYQKKPASRHDPQVSSNSSRLSQHKAPQAQNAPPSRRRLNRSISLNAMGMKEQAGGGPNLKRGDSKTEKDSLSSSMHSGKPSNSRSTARKTMSKKEPTKVISIGPSDRLSSSRAVRRSSSMSHLGINEIDDFAESVLSKLSQLEATPRVNSNPMDKRPIRKTHSHGSHKELDMDSSDHSGTGKVKSPHRTKSVENQHPQSGPSNSSLSPNNSHGSLKDLGLGSKHGKNDQVKSKRRSPHRTKSGEKHSVRSGRSNSRRELDVDSSDSSSHGSREKVDSKRRTTRRTKSGDKQHARSGRSGSRSRLSPTNIKPLEEGTSEHDTSHAVVARQSHERNRTRDRRPKSQNEIEKNVGGGEIKMRKLASDPSLLSLGKDTFGRQRRADKRSDDKDGNHRIPRSSSDPSLISSVTSRANRSRRARADKQKEGKEEEKDNIVKRISDPSTYSRSHRQSRSRSAHRATLKAIDGGDDVDRKARSTRSSRDHHVSTSSHSSHKNRPRRHGSEGGDDEGEDSDARPGYIKRRPNTASEDRHRAVGSSLSSSSAHDRRRAGRRRSTSHDPTRRIRAEDALVAKRQASLRMLLVSDSDDSEEEEFFEQDDDIAACVKTVLNKSPAHDDLLPPGVVPLSSRVPTSSKRLSIGALKESLQMTGAKEKPNEGFRRNRASKQVIL